MNFESISPLESADEKTENPPETKKTKPRRLFSKISAFTGGLMAATSLASASDTNIVTAYSGEKTNSSDGHYIETKSPAPEKQDAMFELLYEDDIQTWGAEYFTKPNSDHMTLRYTKTNKATGETTLIGEYENIYAAAEGLGKIPDVPKELTKSLQYEIGAIQTENNFKKSGLVDSGPLSTESRLAKIHTQEKSFQGYELNVKTTLQTDDQGKTIQILESIDENTGERIK